MELKRTALYDKHLALGAKIVPFAGYEMPLRYTSDIEEHKNVREKVGLFDVSHMGEFVVKGANALDLLQLVCSNDVSVLQTGKVQYAYLPNLQGGIVDDLLVYCLAPDAYMLVVNASNIEKDWSWIQQFNTFGVEMTNISENTSLLALQGVNAQQLLSKLTTTDLTALPYYSFAVGTVAGIPDVIISNTGYTGAGGYELYVPNAFATALWDTLLTEGKDLGIKPTGLGARDTLRLEMGYCLYGNDIDDNTSPLEAGLGWVTKFNKKFNNSESLLRQKEQGLKQKLVAFEMLEKGAIPRAGYEIRNAQDQNIGRVTSGSQSPTLGKGIGLAYVSTDNSKVGTEIFVNIRQKNMKATVAKLPFVQKGI